jgi:hypothetical protein
MKWQGPVGAREICQWMSHNRFFAVPIPKIGCDGHRRLDVAAVWALADALCWQMLSAGRCSLLADALCWQMLSAGAWQSASVNALNLLLHRWMK